VPYQAFKCKDGNWLTIGASSDAMFKKLCLTIFDRSEAESMIKDERFLTNKTRAENRTELIRLISAQMIKKTVKEWLKTFEGSKIAYGPVNNLDEVFKDLQVIHNNSVLNVEHPIIGMNDVSFYK